MYLKFVGHNGSNFWRGAALGIRESSANLELHKQAQRERERERERETGRQRQTDRQTEHSAQSVSSRVQKDEGTQEQMLLTMCTCTHTFLPHSISTQIAPMTPLCRPFPGTWSVTRASAS